jgi:hypothetical protein
MYICESQPLVVTWNAGRGAVGSSFGGSGPILTNATSAAPGASNIIHRTYQGPSIGTAHRFSGAVNGTTTLYYVDNGPTFGKMLSAS